MRLDGVFVDRFFIIIYRLSVAWTGGNEKGNFTDQDQRGSQNMGDDKRKRTRVHFETQVVLKTDVSEITAGANSSDISMKGMFVSTDEKVPVGTSCDIEIVLSGTTSRLALNIEGVVARLDKGGLGITFNSMDVDSYFHLKNIVMYNAQDPDAVEEEMFL
jgi:hypothetical protein